MSMYTVIHRYFKVCCCMFIYMIRILTCNTASGKGLFKISDPCDLLEKLFSGICGAYVQ